MGWSVRGRGYWFVPFVFGLATLGAVGFYQQLNPCPKGGSACSYRLSGVAAALVHSGLSPLQSGGNDGAGIYWLSAVPVALALAVGFSFLHRGHQPIARLIPVAIGGLVLLAAFVGLGVDGGLLPGDFTVRGLVGLMVLSLTMVVMAAVERNSTLGLLSAGAVGVALLANLYNIENLTGNFGGSTATANLVVPAVYFLLAAVVLGIPDVILLARRPSPGSDARHPAL